jgi:ComF family protein
MNKLTVNYRSLFDLCILCLQATKSPSGICKGCQNDLPWLPSHCSICALPLPENQDLHLICGQCLKQKPSFSKVHALFLYQFPVDYLVGKIKYNKKTQYIGHLTQLLSEHVQISSSVDSLVPIPMRQRNLFSRGFNQADLIARELSQHFGVPIDHSTLIKHSSTSKQMGLSRKERLKNQLGAFRCTAAENKHILLVDDVMTTGATLEAASRALLKAGAAQVDAIVIARTGK